MDKQVMLPLTVGQLAESRCFQTGFRGAWFRCKKEPSKDFSSLSEGSMTVDELWTKIRNKIQSIKEIARRKGHIEYALEYFDFPDEKIQCTRIYQVPPGSKMSKEKKRQLMVRPQYPPICHESQMPPVEAFSEETVVINGVWKVGDLLDWSIDGVQWSGRVAQILGDDRLQIELPPPPVGEGSCYEVSCNDLRPSLDWSPEHGWSVPTSKEGENFRLCARIVRPENRGLLKLEIDAVDEGIKDVQPTDASSFDASFSSQISSESSPPTHSKGATERPEENMDLLIGDRAIRKTSSPNSIPCSRVRDTSDETAALPAEENRSFCIGPSIKMRTGGNISLNSMYSDTLIAAALDLEELVNRVKWLKSILEQEVPLSDAGRPQWKFMEHIMASIPK